jgi:hypothetical protein
LLCVNLILILTERKENGDAKEGDGEEEEDNKV